MTIFDEFEWGSGYFSKLSSLWNCWAKAWVFQTTNPWVLRYPLALAFRFFPLRKPNRAPRTNTRIGAKGRTGLSMISSNFTYIIHVQCILLLLVYVMFTLHVGKSTMDGVSIPEKPCILELPPQWISARNDRPGGVKSQQAPVSWSHPCHRIT